MKKVLFIGATSMILFACNFSVNSRRVKGNGNVTAQNRTVTQTSRISVSGPVNVVLREGSSAVRVEADENLLAYVVTTVEDGSLRIHLKDGISISTQEPVRVYVTTPDIDLVELTGSGQVIAESKLRSVDDVEVRLTGSGEIIMPVNSPIVKAAISGSGIIDLSGETRDLEVRVTGSGDFKGDGLRSENAEVRVTRSGDVYLFAENTLNANVTGSGDIFYKGNATADKNITGSGSIVKR